MMGNMLGRAPDMPIDGWGYDYPNESRRIAAWKAHYMRKGCTNTKAYDVACRKVRSARTWPPALQT